MSDERDNQLWRDFPRTAIEFEKRFATEEDCREFWIEARWGGQPACHKCNSTRVWPERGGTLFECAECGHQTSLTSGTILAGTRKPLKTWFRAVFEISARRNGISAKDLQRIMGFGSYKTAWSWLHKLRVALVRPEREPLGQHVQIDEGYVGGTRGGKSMVLVATETTDGRIRLAHAENNDEATIRQFASANVACTAAVTTDGLPSYNAKSLSDRQHEVIVQTKAERQVHDTLQGVHWTISLLKRWLLGTHGGAIKPKYLQAYLDEFAFRHNRRKTNGVGRIAARTLLQLVKCAPMTMQMLVKETLPCWAFRS